MTNFYKNFIPKVLVNIVISFHNLKKKGNTFPVYNNQKIMLKNTEIYCELSL